MPLIPLRNPRGTCTRPLEVHPVGRALSKAITVTGFSFIFTPHTHSITLNVTHTVTLTHIHTHAIDTHTTYSHTPTHSHTHSTAKLTGHTSSEEGAVCVTLTYTTNASRSLRTESKVKLRPFTFRVDVNRSTANANSAISDNLSSLSSSGSRPVW